MKELIAPYMKTRPAFELFKSNVCHKLKALRETLEMMKKQKFGKEQDEI